MDWSIGWKSRDELVGYLTSPSHISAGYELIKSRVVGNNIWHLVKRPDGSTMISLDLIRAYREKGQTDWGYKGMDECYEPSEVNCPLSLLNAADAPRGEYAANWRQNVREYHAKRKARPAYAAGQCWCYGDVVYRLITPALSRRGWIVMAVGTGIQYRMSHHHLRNANLVNCT